jgi:ADP-heptose:LPS heptosyltransferase
VTVGSKSTDAVPLDRWMPYVYFQSEIVRYLEVAALAGAPPVTLEPHLVVTERDRQESFGVVPEGDGPLACLHPGSGDPRRRWPAEKFAAVADALVAASARVFVNGGPGDEHVADAVCTAARTQGDVFTARTSLGGLVGLLSRCAVVVSNDSGPLHLASAVGVPTVGIYWCFNLINSAELTRTRHRPFSSWCLECPVCGTHCMRDKCPHQCSFVADVSEEDVSAAALEWLGAGGR